MEVITMQSASVPFMAPDLFAGLAKVAGIAKATPLELKLEFIVKESVLNLLRTNVKEVRIPRSEIAAIKLKHGLFKDKLVIRVKNLAILQELPGCDNCDVTLRVARCDREHAGDVVVLLGGAATL